MVDLTIAADGYLARVVKPWSHEKLFYVERYLHIFCTGMKGKWTLVYADLLAGPGRSIDQETGQESPGSPLLAVQRPEFDRLLLNDTDQHVAVALAARTADQPPGRVRVESHDCNWVVDKAREFLFPPREAHTTLGLAVIDPTAFQMRFEAVKRLTADVKLDLIIIFMSDFIRRFISTSGFERTMDRFYGTDAWRALVDERNVGEMITYRRLLDLYEAQLKTLGYVHVDDTQRMKNMQGRTVYHLIFASKHERGVEFFKKISQLTYSGQRRLPI